MLKIGEFSKLTKTTVKTLRYYDKIGILKPAFTDAFTSYRYYSEEQLHIAQNIQMYKSIGMTYKKISEILRQESDIQYILKSHKNELTERKSEIDKQLEKLDGMLYHETTQQYHPYLEEIKSYTVYCSRSYVKDITHITDFIKFTLNELKQSNPNVNFPDDDYCCIIYPDDSYRETNICVEYMQSVDKKGVDTPVLKFTESEAITAISVKHYGNYETLRNAYSSAVNYAISNNYKIIGNPRERYIRGAWNCDKTEEWETIIQLPVTTEEIT